MASALVLIVFGGLVSIVFAVWRYSELLQLKSELQDQTLLVFSRVTRDLAETASKTVQTAPDGLLFASPRDENGKVAQDDDGRLKWQKFIAYYVEVVDGVPVLRRKEKLIHPLDRDSDPPSPGGDFNLAGLKAGPGSGHQVARNVSAFRSVRSGEFVGMELVIKRHYARQHRDYQILTQFGFTVRN